MAAREADLCALFERLGIAARTHRHAAVFTFAQSRALRGALPGAHCKSLFLKDKKGALYLVGALEDRALDMKRLRHVIGAHPLSFASPALLAAVLGVAPGAVTPFALINDTDHRVAVVLDAEMMACALLNYHPLTNTATTAIAAADLLAFLRATGHAPRILAL